LQEDERVRPDAEAPVAHEARDLLLVSGQPAVAMVHEHDVIPRARHLHEADVHGFFSSRLVRTSRVILSLSGERSSRISSGASTQGSASPRLPSPSTSTNAPTR